MNRRRVGPIRLATLVIALSWVVAACDDYPTLSISNNSTTDARVTVTAGDRKSSVVVVSGGRLAVDADEGPYSVAVVANTQWLDEGKAIRLTLQNLLSSGALERDKEADIFKQFKDIERRLFATAYLAKSGGKGCSGSIGKNSSGGTVTIGVASTGSSVAFTVACN